MIDRFHHAFMRKTKTDNDKELLNFEALNIFLCLIYKHRTHVWLLCTLGITFDLLLDVSHTISNSNTNSIFLIDNSIAIFLKHSLI